MSWQISEMEGRFTLATYLADKAFAIVVWTVFTSLVAAIMAVMGMGIPSIALIAILSVVSFTGVLAWDFVRRRAFWQEASQLATIAERAHYALDIAEDPSFLEGRLALEIAELLIGKESRRLREMCLEFDSHREYTELWVHEAKTPIAAAKIALDGMRGSGAFVVKEQVERIESLIEQILYLARSNTLSNDYVIREINLLDAVREACRHNMHLLVGKGVSLGFEIEEGVKVFADKAWLEFIVSQVVINSAKYEAKAIRFSAREEMSDTAFGHTVLEIADDGCGIPAADVPRVFNKGFTGVVGRSHGSATGIGLYLVAVMCERMSLGVSIASEEGSGTRVMVSFPHDRRILTLTAS